MPNTPTTTYQIMHQNKCVAAIDETGHAKVLEPAFMPYNLYLEEEDDVDTLVNNLMNFNYWCASRVLTLDRKYAKEILNSIGMSQAVTDRERAKIALSYRCLSLTDVFWVRRAGENVTFSDVNLYENHLENTFIDIPLRGKQYSVQNKALARDLSTNGCFPKAWRRMEDGFWLLKDGDADAVERELLASQICRCFDVDQVLYERDYFDGEKVSISKNFTSQDVSIVSMEAFEIYAANQEINAREVVLNLDAKNYYMMNVVDYLMGNTDRHWGNWGMLVDNRTNQPVSLHKLMDFNQSFLSYDTIEGANCQTLFGKRATQKEAAMEAVHKIGLNQLKEVERSCFSELPQYYEMFRKRLEVLRGV